MASPQPMPVLDAIHGDFYLIINPTIKKL